MQKLFAIIALLCIAHQPLHAQVVQELNTRSAVKVMVVKDGIGIPQVAALPTNPALLNYNSTAATGSPVWCSCPADTLRRGLNIWNGTAWETLRAAELPGTINWLDSTGETQGRPLFTTVGNKTTTSPYYLFSSTLRKLVINSTNISYGGNDKRLAVNGAALISDLYLDGQLINTGPPSGSTTYPLGWNPSTQQVEKYTEWPGGISYPLSPGKYLNAYGTFAPLISDSVPEGSTNQYFTNARARAAIGLTTTGSSGAATYNNTTGILNIPNYTLAGLGGVPSSRTITINGTTLDLSADRSWTISGGGGTPGGSDGQIQYNSSGSFGGSSDLTWNNTTKLLSTRSLSVIRSVAMGFSDYASFGANGATTLTMGYLSSAVNYIKSTYGSLLFDANGTAGGSLTFQANTGTEFSGSSVSTKVYQFQRSIPTATNGTVTLGGAVVGNGAASFDIIIVVPSTGFTSSKRYIITNLYDVTAGAWQTVLPISNGGVDYFANDFDLEIQVYTNQVAFRLRRTAGTTSATANVIVVQHAGTTFNPSNTTSTGTAPTSIYSGSVFTQVNGAVGIGTASPASKSILDVVSKNKGSSPFPRMTQSERTAITGSVGLMVYQTDGTEGVYIYKSTGWQFAF